MYLIYLFLFSLLQIGHIQACDHHKNKPATIKVLIERGTIEPLVEARGRYNVYDAAEEILVASGIEGRRHPVTYDAKVGLKWGELFPGIKHLIIVPGDSQSTLLVNGIEYAGTLEVCGQNSELCVVNEVAIEGFLKSTLSMEELPSMREEELCALAVIRRTDAYHKASHSKEKLWHVAATTVHYQGHFLAHHKPLIERAIGTTQNLVLTKQGAVFSLSEWEHPPVPLQGETAPKILSSLFPDSVLEKR